MTGSWAVGAQSTLADCMKVIKPNAAAFIGSQNLELAIGPERSRVRLTFRSRREPWPFAATTVVVKPTACIKISRTTACAATWTVRTLNFV